MHYGLYVGILGLVVLVACSKDAAQTSRQKSGIQKIRFVSLDSSSEKRTLETLGRLVYYEKADVGSKVEGRIEKIFVREGAFVQQGQELARIEQLQYTLAVQNADMELKASKNAYEMAKNSLADAVRNVHKQIASIRKARGDVDEKRILLKSATTKYSNAQILYKAGGVSKSQLDDISTAHGSASIAFMQAQNSLHIIEIGYRDEDIRMSGMAVPGTEEKRTEVLVRINTLKEQSAVASAENAVMKAQNSLRQAEILLAETSIRSPLQGYIASKGIERGEQVKTDSKLFTVIDVSRMYAQQSVSEDDVGRIQQTGTVQVFVDATDKEFPGMIDLIHPLVDPRSRSVTVRVLLANTGTALRPGMFTKVEFPLVETAKAWMVPAGSVVEKKSNAGFVFLLKKDLVFKTPIVTGSVRGDLIELTGGVEKGMLIAAPPKGENEGDVSSLQDGMKVLPVLPETLMVTNTNHEPHKEK